MHLMIDYFSKKELFLFRTNMAGSIPGCQGKIFVMRPLDILFKFTKRITFFGPKLISPTLNSLRSTFLRTRLLQLTYIQIHLFGECISPVTILTVENYFLPDFIYFSCYCTAY